MYVIELHNIIISDPNDGCIKDAMDEDNNSILSYSTFHSILPPQFKKCQHGTRSCVVVNVGLLLKLYIHHFYPGVINI